jgi:hypothetical protein
MQAGMASLHVHGDRLHVGGGAYLRCAWCGHAVHEMFLKLPTPTEIVKEIRLSALPLRTPFRKKKPESAGRPGFPSGRNR